MLNKILAIAKKDLRLYFYDRKAVLISLAVPVAIGLFFGSVMGGGSTKGPTKVKTLVVLPDNDPVTLQIVAAMKASESLEIEEVAEASAQESVRKGIRSVALVFPPAFGATASQAMFFGTKPQIKVLYDPTQGMDRQVIQGVLMQSVMEKVSQASMSGPSGLQNVEAAIQGARDPKEKAAWTGFRDSWRQVQATQGAATTSAQSGMRQPFELNTQPLTATKDPDAETKGSRAHIFAGMAMQGILFFGIDAAMTMLRERRLGIWSRILAAPVSPATVMLGRGLASWIIASFILTVVFAIGAVVLGIRVEGSFAGFLAVGLAAALMTATFGLLVASLGRTEQQSRGLSTLAVLMMSMLGGAWFPTWMMPDFVQKISLFIPVRWAVDGFDAMSWRGEGLAASLPFVGGLLGFSVVFAAIAAVRLTRTATR
ncbi:MAG: ABC transporter permease [Fimbriimonas sp.]